jgi:hypothetical protein
MRFEVDVYYKESNSNQVFQEVFLFEVWHDVKTALDVLFPFIGRLNITKIDIIIEEEKENE